MTSRLLLEFPLLLLAVTAAASAAETSGGTATRDASAPTTASPCAGNVTVWRCSWSLDGANALVPSSIAVEVANHALADDGYDVLRLAWGQPFRGDLTPDLYYRRQTKDRIVTVTGNELGARTFLIPPSDYDAGKSVYHQLFHDHTAAVISSRPAAEFRRVWSGYLLTARSWRLFHGALTAVAAAGLVGASWWAALRKHRRARFAVPRAFLDERGSRVTPTKQIVSTSWGELLAGGAAWRRLALAAGMVCASEALRAAEPRLPTPAEARERIADKMRKLHALSMEVEIKREPRADTKTLRKWLNKAPLRNDVEEIAFKGGKRHLRHEEAPIQWTMDGMERPEVDPAASAGVQASQREQQRQFDEVAKQVRLARAIDGKDKLPKDKNRPAQHQTTAFNGDQMRRWEESRGRGYICATRSPLKHQFGSLYLSSVGVYLDDPALSKAENRQQREAFLPEAIERGKYEASADTLDGVRCMRLEGAAASDQQPGIFESWWLDLDHALMVRRRELLDSPGGNVLMRVNNSGPKEFVPGVWMPMECEMEEFAPANAPRELRKGPLVVTSLRVRKWSVDVADETFDLRFPPGTVVADGALAEAEGLGSGAAIEYIMPADAGQLDAVAREALKRYQGGMLRRRWWWWPLAASVCAASLWFLFGRFKRRPGAPREGAHG